MNPPGWSLGLRRGRTPLCYFRGHVRVVSTELLGPEVRESDGTPTRTRGDGWVILAPGARNPITGKHNGHQVVEDLRGAPRVFDSATAAARHAELSGWIQ